jgi:hypothetical protein
MSFLTRATQATVAILIAFFTLVAPTSAASISSIAFWAHFGDGTVLYDSTFLKHLPVDTTQPIAFGSYVVPVDIAVVGHGTYGKYQTDIVTISYDLAGTPFTGNQAYLSFEWGRGPNNEYMPAVEVIDFTKWGPGTPGWYLFGPNGYVDFQTFVQNKPIFPDGAPEKGFFTVAFLNPTPVPAALPLMITGLGALGFVGWRRRRASAGTLAPPDP